MINDFLKLVDINLLVTIGRYALIILPIVLPIVLLVKFWNIRYKWLTLKYVEAQKSCLLEIRLPKDIARSPAAMEIFFSYLAQGGAGNWGEAFLDGVTRPWFSCEIVSTGGIVRFFIWSSQAKYRNLIEAQLYAQYPNLEIFEAEDYTKDFYYDSEKLSMAGVQYTLTKADPFPIKTYIDYGLEGGGGDESSIDPITPVIEYLGSLKKGENAWIQILFQKNEEEGVFHGKWTKPKTLKDKIKAEIKKIKDASTPKGGDSKAPSPSKGDLEAIAAIERSAGKTSFDCMIRSLYVAEKSAFTPTNIGGLIGGLKQFSSNTLNGFKPQITASVSNLKKDLSRVFTFMKKGMDEEIDGIKKDLFYAYKLRSYFQGPYKNYGGKPFVLTTEELATIFHFPSRMVAQTPTLQRVGSKKSEAPSNLPI